MSLKPKDQPEFSSFTWDDPFLLDGQLTEDERMIRESAGLCAGYAAAQGDRSVRNGDV